MPTGDSLSIVSMLLSLAVGTAVAAYTVSGAKARNLWIVAALFFVITVGWLLFHARLPFSAAQAIGPLVALVPLLTISVVAVMIRERAASAGHVPAETNLADRTGFGEIQRNALTDLYRALRAGEQAMAFRWQNAEVQRVRPQLEAAMLTLQKEFAFPALPDTGQANMNFGYQVMLLRNALPLIREGHLTEARQAAERQCAEINDAIETMAK